MKVKIDEQILEAMRKDPGNWKGPFYFNKKDPRIIVPKLYAKTGMTFNFASPYPYLTIIAIAIIIIASAYLI
jgi:uncharacterized membrane protein